MVLFIAFPCGADDYYTTIEQLSESSAQIRTAIEFKVRPIDFSAINPSDLGYSNPEEWKNDLKDVPNAFASAFPVLLKEAGIENKNFTLISRDERISQGVIVDVAVTKIILKFNVMYVVNDEFICNISFKNASDGRKLFSCVVNVQNRKRGVSTGTQAWTMRFSERVNSSAYNIAMVLTKIGMHGKIDPEKY
jgi:hypothetical protein